MNHKDFYLDFHMMADSSSETSQPPQSVDLTNRLTGELIYEGLKEVEQDNYLVLSDHPQGLCSFGFATCYAVIVRHTTQPSHIALAHVAVVSEVFIEFFEEMIAQIGSLADVTLSFARSFQGYSELYEMERALDPDKPDPETYFADQDIAFPQFFRTHFPECTIENTIHEMENNILVIDSLGAIQYLDQYPFNTISVEFNEEFDDNGYVANDDISGSDVDEVDDTGYVADHERDGSESESDQRSSSFFSPMIKKRPRELECNEATGHLRKK